MLLTAVFYALNLSENLRSPRGVMVFGNFQILKDMGVLKESVLILLSFALVSKC
jgi:hypothetical protein